MIATRYNFEPNGRNKSILKLNSGQEETRDLIQQKLDNGEYRLEYISCFICGSDNREELASRDRYGLENRVSICHGCGLVYTVPRMDQNSFTDFYRNYYRILYSGSKKATHHFFQSQYRKTKSIVNFIHGHLKLEGSKILEVGCGAGGILQHMKDRGAEVKGLELDDTYIQYGRDQYGLDLSFGMLTDLSTDERFDLIIYSHVMEHVLDIEKEIAEINCRLNPGGLLYIEVPGIKNLKPYDWDFLRYLQNAHTYHFSLSSLKNAFESYFSLVKGDEKVRTLFRKTSKTSVGRNLDSDFESTMQYLQSAEKKRITARYSTNMLARKVKRVYYKLKLNVLKLYNSF